ncbi:putative cyp51a protein [Phaeoacremonium minimum UCRPA7]|uniref:Putative cyp51a protein n=1 Tax=Phaeoacremonium minimum (strain UCR-PA7) TaxID=1286976 RepID=R8B953_PHAM7|nr:putative cyp51a protein [Phaeoacremonium minimum UCRPA7]EON95812.1 putative cyp51a protein [Phaeoacremonium minimum UCRPA7]
MLSWTASVVLVIVISNVIRQLLPRPKSEPPLAFHWLPFLGNAIEYGIDPYKFFLRCREKHGDIFTFVLLGKRITCYLGVEGNEFILNGKHQDLNAEEIYSPLTTPVFGADVVYDCPNAKLMEQKKFVKFGLTTQSFECYVPLIECEVLDYIRSASAFQGESGTINVCQAMSEITILTAARALQGEEVRQKLSAEFALLYHDLDMGFQPINFLMPWAPLPHNKKRDEAHMKMKNIYMDIIERRRRNAEIEGSDMIWNLMNCEYKDGTPVPDAEIACIMITLLMAGQHTSASASSWIMVHLASRPDIVEQLYQEQLKYLGRNGELAPLQYPDVEKLPLMQSVIKETLRMHSAIHSVMRKVKRPMRVPDTSYIITPDKVLLASPLVTAMSEDYFDNAEQWDPHRWASIKASYVDHVDIGDDASISKGSKSPYLPFGAGRHRCVGEKFAYLNLTVIIASLVRNFHFYTLDGTQTVPKTDYASLLSRPKEPSTIRWERRDAKTSQRTL